MYAQIIEGVISFGLACEMMNLQRTDGMLKVVDKLEYQVHVKAVRDPTFFVSN